jgi:DNA-binding IclR family transcriptional regulator
VVEAATGRSTPQLIALRTGIPRDKVASLLSYMAKAGMVHRAAFGEYLPAQRKAMV